MTPDLEVALEAAAEYCHCKVSWFHSSGDHGTKRNGRVTVNITDSASFRDPSGFVYRGADGTLLRQVNPCHQQHFCTLMESGLYESLTTSALLVEHKDVPISQRMTETAWRVIQPREVSFISYPYEWSFSQLKEAALLTLEIQRRALRFGMSLKDASAYNIQYEGGHPVFIDTLSFEQYHPGEPWVAYGQFCRHFLAPLALMAKADVQLNRLCSLYIDGIPLDLAAKILPPLARFNLGLLMHIFMHARSVKRHAATRALSSPQVTQRVRVSQLGLNALIDNLARTVRKLDWRPSATAWRDYYADNAYTDVALERKKQIVSEYLDHVEASTVWDLGANTGVFSRIATDKGADVVAFDIDPACVEINFLECRKRGDRRLLALYLDLTNPSPGVGWANSERRSHAERGPVDTIMALALIHHLRISNNVPLANIANYLHLLCRFLIIEFVPKQDPQVQRLLRSRADIFSDYHQDAFEAAFTNCFTMIDSKSVGNEGRKLYLMAAKP